ncbi:hypothetical protein ACFLQ2_04515 [archaeon]
MLEYYALAASFVVALVSSWVVTKWIIPKALERNFTGRDVHKAERVFVSELGGVGISIGFMLGVFTFVGLSNYWNILSEWSAMFAAVASVLVIFIIGLMDDLFEIPWGQKSLLPVIGAIPLVVLGAGDPTMVLPILGLVNFGLIYYLVLVPLGVTGSANAMNMIGGYNGSEAGLGIMIMAAMAVIAFASGSVAALAILLAMIAALLGFLFFNWYPAKIFMGDAGTFQIGAVIAAAAIIGNMEKYAVLLFALYFFNLVIFAWGILTKAKLVKFAHPDKDGKLVAPESFWKHYLPFVVVKLTHPTEQQVVSYLIGLQAIVSLVVVALYFGGF